MKSKFMKKVCVLIIGFSLAISGDSQIIQQQVEKQIQDPKRKENAGKADAFIAKKRNIFDSTTFNNSTTEATNNKTVKANSKKKDCGNKTKTSTKRR